MSLILKSVSKDVVILADASTDAPLLTISFGAEYSNFPDDVKRSIAEGAIKSAIQWQSKQSAVSTIPSAPADSRMGEAALASATQYQQREESKRFDAWANEELRRGTGRVFIPG